jgi:uncharacterized membrane protein YcaP (DUF421 family)
MRKQVTSQPMEDILMSLLRTFVSFIILSITTFLIGKQINTHNNHFTFAMSIIIGSFIANMGFDLKLKFLPMFASFAFLVAIHFLLASTALKSRRLRKWITGRPTVIMEKGKLLEANMKKVKYSIDDLNQHLRELGTFNIAEVEFAVLEVSGKLSVLKKTAYQNIAKQDVLSKPFKEMSLPVELIMDGEIIHKNLTSQYTEQWINLELSNRQLQLNQVLYAVVSTNGMLYVDEYKDQLSSPTDRE